MNWIILIIASLFEIGFAVSMGKLRTVAPNVYPWWFAAFSICLVMGVYLLFKATETLPLGTAYAVWTGIGAVGISFLGIVLFKEPTTFWRLFFMITLIASIVGLKLAS